MNFLTNDKLVIVGAGGAIGSNMAQTALMLGLTPNICLYDIYGPGVNGVAEELYHCAFEGANITWTTDQSLLRCYLSRFYYYIYPNYYFEMVN